MEINNMEDVNSLYVGQILIVRVNLQTPKQTFGDGSTMIREKDSMEMVYVQAGNFSMGSEDGDDDEQPVHEVYLDAYWIDKYEVTNHQFAQFVDAMDYETDAEKWGSSYVWTGSSWEEVNGADWSHPQGPSSDSIADHPVVHVSWNDAVAYCEWAGGGLSTEAEWEKAARGTDERVYPWGNHSITGNLANYADANLDVDWADEGENDGYEFTAPMGSYPSGASPYGVMDMAGNVYEWVADWYDGNYYSNSPAENPRGPDDGNMRILRGGSWSSVENLVRSAIRGWSGPDGSWINLGFRCVRTIEN